MKRTVKYFLTVALLLAAASSTASELIRVDSPIGGLYGPRPQVFECVASSEPINYSREYYECPEGMGENDIALGFRNPRNFWIYEFKVYTPKEAAE